MSCQHRYATADGELDPSSIRLCCSGTCEDVLTHIFVFVATKFASGVEVVPTFDGIEGHHVHLNMCFGSGPDSNTLKNTSR